MLAQPSTDASQQRFHRELLCMTGFNHLLKAVKRLMFFSKIFDFSKPIARRTEKILTQLNLHVVSNSLKDKHYSVQFPEKQEKVSGQENQYETNFSRLDVRLSITSLGK